MNQAETRNRFADVDSALLLTEFEANKKALKELDATTKEQRNEIENRLNAGLTVANSTKEAYIQRPKYKIYNVARAITQIRKHKIDPASILKVVNKAVEALPADILKCIPYVEEVGTKVMTRARSK